AEDGIRDFHVTGVQTCALPISDYLRTLGVPFHVIEQDTYSVVKRVIPEGRTLCGLCSRLRRGALYRFAAEHGMTKIALGHHRDEIGRASCRERVKQRVVTRRGE